MGETSAILKRRILPARSARAVDERNLITQALENLKAIPNLEVKQVSYESGKVDRRLDCSFLLSFGQKKFKIAAEVKASGEPSLLRRSAAWLKNSLTSGKYDYAMIIAPFVSREGAEICRESGVGFVDLSGNCLLSLDGLYVERTGYPNKFKKPR